MKTPILIAFAGLFLLTYSIDAAAQLKDGDLVKIKNVNSGKYIRPGNTISGSSEQVVLSDAANDAQCRWKVVLDKTPRSTGGPFYRLQNAQTNKFLGVFNASMESYGLICQKPDANQQDQWWKLESTSTAFKLKNKNSGLYIAVEGGSRTNGSPLIQWGDEGQQDILWQFETLDGEASEGRGRKVLFDVILHYIGVSEATRNRIDNGDCKRIFGYVRTELWELDNNNEMRRRLSSYNNQPEFLFQETNSNSPPTSAVSYYQERRAALNNSVAGKITYNIPEAFLQQGKVMLIVKTYLGSRHKDSDLSSYDALGMKEQVQSTFIINSGRLPSETIQVNTDLTTTFSGMGIELIGVSPTGPRTDDTHTMWVKFSCKIN